MGFTDARAATERVLATRRRQAARTVADNSLDAHDRRELLSMLDLPDPVPSAAAPHDTHELAPRTTGT